MIELKQIIILRKDLKMSCGKAAAQASHASVAAAIKSQREKLQEFTTWWKTGQKKVVLAVNSEAELDDLETKLRATGVVTVKIDDAGRTQLPPNTSTALGIGPHARTDVEKITSQLKLY